MVNQISREDIPQFNSHDEARAYFEQKYGTSNFELVEEVTDRNEGKFYLYKLILDAEAYKKGMQEIKEKGYCSNEAFIKSTQRIKIMANGEVFLN
jgi:hypothetical protein